MVNIPLYILLGFQPSFWWCRISQPSTLSRHIYPPKSRSLSSAPPGRRPRRGRAGPRWQPHQDKYHGWYIYIYYIYTVYIHIILVHNRLYDMIDILAIGQYENGISSCNFVQIELVHNDSIWFYWSNIMECATLTHAGQTMGVSGMFTSNIGVWSMYNGYIWDV